MTVQTSGREPGWLRRSVTRLFAIVGVFLFPVAVGVAWSLDAVGNAYQLLGVFIAALGVPVVEPRLLHAEPALEQRAREASAWVRARPGAVRRWWRRRRGRVDANVNLATRVSIGAASEVSVAGTLTVARSIDQQLAFLQSRVDTLEREQSEHAADTARQLAAQREELLAHAVSVTQQGWQYIVSGAACSAFGTFLALVA